MKTLRLLRLASGLLALGAALDLAAQVSITSIGTNVYVQDFNSLASTGTSNTWANNSTLVGWYSDKGAYGTQASWTGNNFGIVNNLLSFGTDGSTERALGSANPAGGTSVTYGVWLRNDTSAVLDLTISFAAMSFKTPAANDPAFGEVYKDVTVGSWSSTATTLGGTGWTPESNLSLASTTTGSRTLAVANLGIGESFWIRWQDPATSPINAGLGIDNFTVSAVPEPSTYALFLGLGTLGMVAVRRWRARR